MDHELSSMLKKEEFFSNLPQADLNSFVSSLKLQKHTQGEVLIAQGEKQTKLFVIQHGTVQKAAKEGNQSLLKKGQLSGFFHFYQQDPSPATLTCVEDCEIWVLDTATFRKILEDSTSFHDAFISFLTRQVRKQLKAINTFKTSKALIGFYDTKAYQKSAFEKLNQEKGYNFEFLWLSERLSKDSAVFAQNCDAVCCFVNDDVGAAVLDALNDYGIQMIAMRCAGFDNVDLDTIKKNQMSVSRVPEYSPYAVAEFATGVLLSLNRKIHKAYQRTREHNFSLDNFVGFDLHGKTVGVLGTGKIGKCFINIMVGFGCNVLCYDVREDPEIAAKQGVKYTTKEEVYEKSHIISLHLPLLKTTKHFLNKEAFDQMKKGVILVNTSRGGLIDSEALLDAIVSGKVGGAGLDVYEGEKEFFFEDKSERDIMDTTLSRLLSSPKVLVSSHQAFLTEEALRNIADTTLISINEFISGKRREQLTYAIK